MEMHTKALRSQQSPFASHTSGEVSANPGQPALEIRDQTFGETGGDSSSEVTQPCTIVSIARCGRKRLRWRRPTKRPTHTGAPRY